MNIPLFSPSNFNTNLLLLSLLIILLCNCNYNIYLCYDRNILQSVGGKELGRELVDKYRELYGSGYVR